MTGKSSVSSSAPSSTNRSKTSVEHLAGPGVRAVDLVDDDDRLAARTANALRSTNRVCGIGPSAASTSRNTPSAIFSTRSTSPPKSAWPGVSIRLILVSSEAEGDVLGQDGDAALALQVVGVEDEAVLAADELVQLLGAEQAGLAEHLIDQRRLAVVDVGDDGDVADVVSLHGFLARARGGRVPRISLAGERVLWIS